MIATANSEETSEKARDGAPTGLWTDVNRNTHTADVSLLASTLSAPRERYLAERNLDEIDLDGRDRAETFGRVADDVLTSIADPHAIGIGIDLDRLDPAPSTVHAVARCSDGHGTLTHLFFSDDEFDIARAKAICSKCRLAPGCLAGALERGEAYGVWGGELLIDGVTVAVKRGRGRPPKTPRAVLVVDEVPLPPHLVA